MPSRPTSPLTLGSGQNSAALAGDNPHSRSSTFSRSQKARLVPPSSPLAARGALDSSANINGGSGGGGLSTSGYATALSAPSAVGSDSGKANLLTRGGVAQNGPWGSSYSGTTAASGRGTQLSRSTVRRPVTYANTLKLLEEKPDEVPRAVVQVCESFICCMRQCFFLFSGRGIPLETLGKL